jgi:tetratricopeptide repeat protein
LPENAEARLYRAFIYMQRRQYKEARIDYNTILTKNPEHAEALLGLAYLNQKERQYKEAMTLLDRLVKAHPEEPAYLKARVNLSIEMGNMDLALLDVEMLERKGKDDGESWLLKGDILLQQKKKKKALEAYRKALEKGISPIEVQDKIKACR